MMAPALDVLAAVPEKKNIAFHNLHTGEDLQLCYRRDGQYRPEAMQAINHILRDHRTGDIKNIDPALIDLLHALAHQLETDQPFHIISGYRSPATNAMLRRNSANVAKKSMHMLGRAIDIRLPGIGTKSLRQAAMHLQAGGVGYYPRSGFVHLDTGRVRFW